jgi:hypothetical protein
MNQQNQAILKAQKNHLEVHEQAHLAFKTNIFTYTNVKLLNTTILFCEIILQKIMRSKIKMKSKMEIKTKGTAME